MTIRESIEPSPSIQALDDNPWANPETSLQGRYDDPRLVILEPGFNHEIGVRVGDQGPVFVDALDLLRITAHVTLILSYDPSPTEQGRLSYWPVDQ